MTTPSDDAPRWIDDHAAALPKTLREWAEINSGSSNPRGLARMADTLGHAFAPLGLAAERLRPEPYTSVDTRGQTVSHAVGPVLRFRHEAPGAPSVLLAIHYDTVYGPDDPFQSCTTGGDGRMTGPGVADAKGGILVMLTALRALHATGSLKRIGLEVLLNADEELGSPASREVLARAAADHDFALLLEPALEDGSMVDQRGGSGNFAVVVRGRSAHVGRHPERGRNAVVAAARIALALDRLNAERPGVTVNAARIDGGGPLNIVPDTAVVRFNVRYRADEDERWLRQQIDAIVRDADDTDGIAFELHGGFSAPPKTADAATDRLKAAVERCAARLGLPTVTWRQTAGVCDGNRLAAAGLANIDSLGVRGGNLHSRDEFVVLESIAERAKLLALLLLDAADRPDEYPRRGG